MHLSAIFASLKGTEEVSTTGKMLPMRAPVVCMREHRDSQIFNDDNDNDDDDDDGEGKNESKEEMSDLIRITGHRWINNSIDIRVVLNEGDRNLWISAAELQKKHPEMLYRYWESNDNPTNPKNKDMHPIFNFVGLRRDEVCVHWLCYRTPTWEPYKTIRKTARSLIDKYSARIANSQVGNRTDKIQISGDRKYMAGKLKGSRNRVTPTRGREVKRTLRKRKGVKYGK
jgi:hypothetical protein